MADDFIKYRKNINYASYILKNPLYIHNHRKYFENTLNNLNNLGADPLSEAESLYESYIFYLEEREKNILDTLGGEEVLNKIIDEAFVSNANIKEIINLLNKVFYMGQDIKSSISKGDEEGVRYLRLTTGKKGKKRQDIIKPIKLIIDEENPTKQVHGRIINNYDLKASAKKVTPAMRAALLNIVREIQTAIGSQQSINKEMEKFVNTSLLTKDITNKNSPFFRYIESAMSFGARPSNEELLEFIINKMGTYSALKGQFTEAAEIEFGSGLQELLGKNFSAKRGDTRPREERQGTFKKPDLILSGGIIDEDLNPITVSMKSISGEKDIKVQNSPLMGDNGGIFQAFSKDAPNVAKLYLYLMLNHSYYEDDKALEIINLINRYMSYIFISGTIKTEIGAMELPSNQALYLVLNQSLDTGVKVSFIPISKILKAMKEGDIKITNTRKSTTNLNPLWYTKIKSVGFERKNSKRLKNLTYENLYNNSLVIDKVKEVADSLLTRDRKIDIKYNVINGIIT